MSDQLDNKTVVRLIVVPFFLAWFTVVGLTAALCVTPSCGCRLLCAVVGIASGAVLFLQIACAQIERYYQGAAQCQVASPGA